MKNKYENLVVISIIMLIVCFLIKLIDENFFFSIFNNEVIIDISNYINKNVLFFVLDFALFYILCYYYYKSILRVKKFEGKLRYLFLLFLGIYVYKVLVSVFTTSNLQTLLNRILQMLIFIPLFFIFKKRYKKVSYEQNFIHYILHTIILFCIACSLTLPFYLSLIFIALLSYAIIDAIYYLEDYLQHLRTKKVEMSYGMDEEYLLQKCKEFKLTPLETNVLVMFYCKKMKRYEIGIKLGYSEDSISKIKSKALSKFA